jgi:Fe-S-cluster containining protein
VNFTDYFINSELCKKCGGRCCKSIPGHYIPSEIENLEQTLKEKFKSKEWSIDWWEGDPREKSEDYPDYIDKAYFVRPRLKNCETIFDPTWGGDDCVYLRKNGCILPIEERPYGCRMLFPQEPHCVCKNNSGKQDAAIAWLPFNELLDKIVIELNMEEVSL